MVENEGNYQKNMESSINCQSYCFILFLENLVLEAMKRQKLFNEENFIIFIDSTSIKMSPDSNKNQDNQGQIIRGSKRG